MILIYRIQTIRIKDKIDELKEAINALKKELKEI